MKSPEEIRLLAESLESLGGYRKEVSLLWLLLGENNKSDWQVKYEELVANPPSADAALQEANKDLSRMVLEQDAQIKDLKEKLSRFMRDGMVPKAEFEAEVQKRIAFLQSKQPPDFTVSGSFSMTEDAPK